METGTVYSYLLNSIDKPNLYDIRALSADFITRLSPELVGILNKEVCIAMPNKRAIKPQNEAQMHAYIYANIIKASHEIEHLMIDKDRDYASTYDYSIIDYDCGVGLSTIALIHYFKEQGWDNFVKEIILVDGNAACLQRAELLTKSMLPYATVKVVQKELKELVPEDVHTEHMMTYHLLCSEYNTVDANFTAKFLKNNRYLFSTILFRTRSVDYEALDQLRHFFCETNHEGYGIAKLTDISTVAIKKEKSADSHFDCFSYSLNNSDDKNYDSYYDEIKSFIINRDGATEKCFYFFKGLAEKSILAKYNLARCLVYGIGCEKNCEEAASHLKQLAEMTEGEFKAKILGTLAQCVTNREEIISLYRQSISLLNDENIKCAYRSNLAYYLSDKEESLDEVEYLHSLCIENGCNNCEEASKYDTAKRSCPKAQYKLSYICEKRGDIDDAFHLMQESANQGYTCAINNLGVYYANGQHIAKDMTRAIALFREAADSGLCIAQKNLFKFIKKEKPEKAFWYLTLACNSKDTEAQELMLGFLPKVVSGKLKEELNNYWTVILAEEGIKRYQEQAVDILVRTGDSLMKAEDIDEAREKFKRLAQFDTDLSVKKLQELDDNTPDWYYEHDECFIEPYSYYDSMMDALDGDPDAYWNID